MVKFSPGSLTYVDEDIVIVCGELFLHGMISQISLRGSPVCGSAFTCEASGTGEIQSLARE